tara:strand:- start:1094 stop:1273 length:180 start_codon:yes stop_codon:yes gene_type:complete
VLGKEKEKKRKEKKRKEKRSSSSKKFIEREKIMERKERASLSPPKKKGKKAPKKVHIPV